MLFLAPGPLTVGFLLANVERAGGIKPGVDLDPSLRVEGNFLALCSSHSQLDLLLSLACFYLKQTRGRNVLGLLLKLQWCKSQTFVFHKDVFKSSSNSDPADAHS